MNFGERYTRADEKTRAGGMSHVYACHDQVLDRPVAIKVVKQGVEARRLQDEIQALLKLRSKHVVQIYDLLTLADGSVAIVQEFIDGPDLWDRATQPSDSGQFIKHLWQIASGIADIHEQGVIHRDIKPNNMKVDREGVLKVFDFGLARDEGPSASTMGFAGTTGFAAPELFGQKVVFTPAVDTFAFGATALFIHARKLPSILTGKPPGEPDIETIAKLLPGVAPDIIGIIRRCLLRSPSARPLMHEVRDLLSRRLLFDRHRALLVYNGEASHLDANVRSVTVRIEHIGGLKIEYDGFVFKIVEVFGDVFINNRRAEMGQELPGSCVIALGSPDLQARRRYVTFDLSSPEVVL